MTTSELILKLPNLEFNYCIENDFLVLTCNYGNMLIEINCDYKVNEEPYEEEGDTFCRSFGGSTYFIPLELNSIIIFGFADRDELHLDYSKAQEKEIIDLLGEFLKAE